MSRATRYPVPRDPRAASVPRRMLAAVVDSILIVAMYALPVAVVARRRPAGERLEATSQWITSVAGDDRVTRTLQVGSPIASVLLRPGRSPGSWVAGIRRVDTRDGGPPGRRALITEALLAFALQQIVHRVSAPSSALVKERSHAVEEQVEALRESLADEPERLERETAALYRANGTNCLTGMIRPFATGAAQPLTALLSPRRQTVIERIAGLAFVRDR